MPVDEARIQYVVKVHMHTGVVTVGPYSGRDEAERLAVDIAFGDANTLCLQNNGLAILTIPPEYVEVLPSRTLR